MSSNYSLATYPEIEVINLNETSMKRLASNFYLSEFTFEDQGPVVLIHPKLPQLLQAIRDKTGRPIHINSAYRTAAHNVEIGGHANSRHMFGMAADIVSEHFEPEEIAEIANKLQAGGVGKYPTFTHVDVWGMGRRF
jgi:uncharacterized protein YcbK (DUF882 family)